MLCTIQEIGKVKVGYVVADDNVGIHLLHEISPRQQHLLLGVVGEDLSVDDQTARVEDEDITNKGFCFSISRHHVGNLDDGILVGLREYPFAAGAFNVKGQDPQRRHLGPLSVIGVRDQVSVMDKGLNLAIRLAFSRRQNRIFLRRNLDPRHTRETRVDHESQHILDAVECHDSSIRISPQPLVVGQPILNGRSQFVDEFWIRDGNLDIWVLLVALKAEEILPHHNADRVDSGLVLCELGFEMGFVRFAVGRDKRRRGCDI
jgi:hypothetical protein